MMETNELTRTLKTQLIPKAALIAYASEDDKNFSGDTGHKRSWKHGGRQAYNAGIHERACKGIFGKA